MNGPGVSETTGAGGTVPVPLSATVCGEPLVLSATDSVAEKLVAEAGVKVTEMVQLDPAASDAPQVFIEIAKSLGFAPVIAMLLMVSAALPVFISVAVCAALVDPVLAVKVKGPGVSETTGAGAFVPVPFSVTVCGEPLALSATDSVAAKLVADAGVKVTEMPQLDPAASDAPQVFIEIAKSLGFAPVIAMLPMVSAALPVFISVAVCSALVEPVFAVKVNGPGVSETTGAGAFVPVPFSVTVCGEPLALSATESMAVKPVTAAGVNVIEMPQLDPAASEAPQVFIDTAKSLGFAPVMAMLPMVSAALPVFISVAVCAALVVPVLALKVNGPGVSETAGAGAAVPVPSSGMVCGEPAALSETETVAAKALSDSGENVREIEQLDPAASEAPQVLLSPKLPALAPSTLMLLMVSAALPVFFSVAICAALVAPLAAVNASEDGVRDTTGAGAGDTFTVTAPEVLAVFLLSPP